jgi:hypothetical protein
VAKVKLFPRVGFIVTNLNGRARNVVEFCGRMAGSNYAHPRAPNLDQGPRRSVLWAVALPSSGISVVRASHAQGICHPSAVMLWGGSVWR